MTIRPEGSAPCPAAKVPLPRPRRRYVDAAVIGTLVAQGATVLLLVLLIAAAVRLPSCPSTEPVHARP